jgi:hypothetical protein
MNQYVILASTGILGPILFIISVYLYSNSQKYSINWPGNDKWNFENRIMINTSFRRHALIGMLGNTFGVIVGLLTWKLEFYEFNTALILSTIICMGSILLSLVGFLVRVPKIIRQFNKE